MYCILVTGIPAAGKSTMAEYLAEQLCLPVISKDSIKELLYDTVGFNSREEKVRLGVASMNIMYYMAEKLMQREQAFILENNFEHVSKEGLLAILDRYSYKAITVTLTGTYKAIYERFLERNSSPNRHRGHVVNDCYPEKKQKQNMQSKQMTQLSYEDYVGGIASRGMDSFVANGPQIIVDTTDFSKIDYDEVLRKIAEFHAEILHD